MSLSRNRWLVTGIYILTLFVCILIGWLLGPLNPILKVFMLDIVGTVIIFSFSMIFNNSSIYDPYWSLAPIPMLIYWTGSLPDGEGYVFRQGLILSLVLIWGSRLTYNWFRRWKGLGDEDWRYRNFRRSFKNSYWLVSFFGIHLFPTLIVFLACLAVFPSLQNPQPLSWGDWLAIFITGFAILIEMVSDKQLHDFLLQDKRPEFLTEGLWKYSRHPNYFGEVLFWLGLALFSIFHTPFHWWILPGPVVMTLMFYFISIPMIDKRMTVKKTRYKNYKSTTPGLIPWFPKVEKPK